MRYGSELHHRHQKKGVLQKLVLVIAFAGPIPTYFPISQRKRSSHPQCIIDLSCPQKKRGRTRPPHPPPLILPPIKLQHLLPHQRRPLQPLQLLIQRPLRSAEARFPTRPRAAIDGVQKLFDLILRADAFLDRAAREVQLVSPVRHAGFDDGGEGRVFCRGGPVGGAEDEEVRDEVRVPEGCSVGDGAALGVSSRVNIPKGSLRGEEKGFGGQEWTHPVVAAQNDGLTAQLSG